MAHEQKPNGPQRSTPWSELIPVWLTAIGELVAGCGKLLMGVAAVLAAPTLPALIDKLKDWLF